MTLGVLWLVAPNHLAYTFVLNDKFLDEQNVSTYPLQPKNEKGEVHQHWSFFS